jgi:ABC-type proline/glycine betaine transport system ATPase subunit
MDAGQVSEYGSPEELLTNPKSQFSQLVAAEQQQQQQQHQQHHSGSSVSVSDSNVKPDAALGGPNSSSSGTSSVDYPAGAKPVTTVSGKKPAAV